MQTENITLHSTLLGMTVMRQVGYTDTPQSSMSIKLPKIILRA